jgi:1-acyl-sn-glycerol-3-phosphate acyltransferase
MFTTLLAPVRGVAALLFLILSTFFWGWAIFPLGILKLVVPIRAWRRLMTRLVLGLANSWAATNRAYFRVVNRLSIEVYGVEGLERRGRYLVLCNHQTWADILILLDVFTGTIPLTRYFMKQELIWLPVIGFTCWALDMPIVKRYSREELTRRPELAGKDLEATRRSSLKYRDGAVTLVNFVEGTRFTAEKHARQESPHVHLLKPRAGGVAFVLEVMGDILTEVLDVTIVYPGERIGFWDFLCGRVKKVIVVVERIALTDTLRGSYSADEQHRLAFQNWLNALWADKDAKIGRLKP